jgi:hypothetical protein
MAKIRKEKKTQLHLNNTTQLYKKKKVAAGVGTGR